MTTTLNAPTQRVNSAASDYMSDSGVRISTPIYLDLSGVTRKQLFSDVRTVASRPITTSVKTVSGLSVDNYGSSQHEVESFLGCTLDVLRTLMFQRGGLNADLVLKLQAVVGYEVVSVKDIEAAYKAKVGIVKDIIKSNIFPSNGLP